MANLRDVRLRMRAIRQTLQVTKAMNLISTAKLRKGRRILEDTEPFFTRIQKSMFDILSGAGKFDAHVHHTMLESEFFAHTNDTSNYNTAIIVVTSDKGLAGGYNANIFRQVTQLCAKVRNPILILIGSIGYRYFIHSPYLILENFSFKSRLPELDDAKEISDYVISQFLWGMFDEVHIVYTHMHSSIKLLPTERQILPLNVGKMQKEFEANGGKRAELQFEYLPTEQAVFDSLVPLYIKGIIYGSLVESYVSEQSARMAAMDEASKSAEDMLDSLQINYNRARQAGITQEMTEIIGGSSALSD
ncbi:ATP synthase F1 subunit gamma [Leadbettera azotonutricia]|uniref:ATP synthase gamma chain n=1 Tax=Leadbettera azotonutricia (strain ATCC BAA-888 / DSM 13862 / ZAS-9) TaxID=545695 RepID=F5YCG1_LEAAZ|nr:ATP synthase F1 subunit gamma [Leadbettera azotonutricia]AEF83430.1 ATP synthase F1, gamma subunit [Leadbettera azotonutricia ZAS-9]